MPGHASSIPSSPPFMHVNTCWHTMVRYKIELLQNDMFKKGSLRNGALQNGMLQKAVT